MNSSCLIKHIDDKSIVWFEARNEYITVPKKTGTILEKIYSKVPLKNIAEEVSEELSVPFEKAIDFILDVEKFYQENTQKVSNEIVNDYRDSTPPKNIEFVRYYCIQDVVIKVEFATEFELHLVHYKFAHLETPQTSKNYKSCFTVFTDNSYTFLHVDNSFIGAWSQQDIHFFQGKFSMELVQTVYHKKEDEWLGVFHASAVGKEGNCMLFLGDSGNGKSTSLALLQAHGFDCIADDFVPVDALHQEVYEFPAAISIKRSSIPILKSYYPALESFQEYHFKRLNKLVRYLPPHKTSSLRHIPCIGCVFIKYQKDSPTSITKIPTITAFEKLIPDSWLSPLAKNATIFLDWFANQPCYQLTYSDNQEMINTVNKLFNDEL